MTGLPLHTHSIHGTSLVVVDGDLDIARAARLRVVVRQAVQACGQVVVDLTDVTLLDAGAAGVLVQQRGRARDRGGDLRVVGATGIVLEVLELLGLAKDLRAYDGRDGVHPRPDARCCRAGADDGVVPEEGNSVGEGFPNELVQTLTAEARRLEPGDPYREALRERAIAASRPAAYRLARRYFDRGEARDDLLQVAAFGLVKAVDGYDPGRGYAFADYAIPTILGELRRHFRDRAPTIRAPRRLQELRLTMRPAIEALTQELGRAPTDEEVAEAIHQPAASVAEASLSGDLYRPASLSVVMGDGQAELGDMIGGLDPGYEQVDNGASLARAIAWLPPRTQRILALRFYGNLTQSEIAADLGLSQMHVSRLLNQAYTTLREALTDKEPSHRDSRATSRRVDAGRRGRAAAA